MKKCDTPFIIAIIAYFGLKLTNFDDLTNSFMEYAWMIEHWNTCVENITYVLKKL